MRALELKDLRRVLCLGAHSDDLEIGAGGTILSLVAARPDVEIQWVVFSAHGNRAAEASASAARFLEGCKSPRVQLFEFRDGFLPYVGAAVKDAFESLKSSPGPDLILTHHRRDLHQDHRLVSELTWNTFRDHAILEYEIPKYDGGLETPNVYVALEDAVFRRKVEILMEVFATQRSRRWFEPRTFEAIARLRGLESNAASGYAEGFHGPKLRVDLT